MVGGGPGFSHSQNSADFGDDIRLEVATLVRVQLFWGGETKKILIRELTGHGGGSLIRDLVCLCPAGEVVSHHQDVCIASQ